MVVIRLSRGGSANAPYYQVVVANSRYPRDGRFKERLGYFNPMARGNQIRLHLEQQRIEHWVSQGAQLTDRVRHLMADFKNGLTGPVAPKPKKPKKVAKAAVADEAAPDQSAAATE